MNDKLIVANVKTLYLTLYGKVARFTRGFPHRK
jgi:hypothetical protein